MEERPRVLCVDDEPRILEGIKLHLRRHYDVVAATSGAAGLEVLAREPPFQVVLSDMRMPEMNGARFLAAVRERAPDTTRMLLTGQTDLDSAIAAVNDGHIFRFLAKPCPPERLLAAFADAVEQHRLRTSERVLLEETLRGSIQALSDVLALVSPLVFGRATRLKRTAGELAEKLGLPDRWQVEVAAMLSELASVTLPAATAERLCRGEALSPDEQAQVARLPQVADKLLAHVPRLEQVRALILGRDARAPVLKAAAQLDALEAAGTALPTALGVLRGHGFAAELVDALAELRGVAERPEVRELPLRQLSCGMVLAEDALLESGALLAARGYEVSPSFVERARNFPAGAVREPIRVLVKRAH